MSLLTCQSCKKSAHLGCQNLRQNDQLHGVWRCQNCEYAQNAPKSKCFICRSSDPQLLEITVNFGDPNNFQVAQTQRINDEKEGTRTTAHYRCIQENKNIYLDQSTNRYKVDSNYFNDMSSSLLALKQRCFVCQKKKGELHSCKSCPNFSHYRCNQMKLNSQEDQSNFSIKGTGFKCFKCQTDPMHLDNGKLNQSETKTQLSVKSPRYGQEVVVENKQNDNFENQISHSNLMQDQVAPDLSYTGQIPVPQNPINQIEEPVQANIPEEEKISQDFGQVRYQEERDDINQGQSIGSDKSSEGQPDQNLNKQPQISTFKRRQKKSQEDWKKKNDKILEVSIPCLNKKQQSWEVYNILHRDIMEELIFNIDKLQVLKRDKLKYQIALKLKDLQKLTKAQKEDVHKQKRAYLAKAQITENVPFVLEIQVGESMNLEDEEQRDLIEVSPQNSKDGLQDQEMEECSGSSSPTKSDPNLLKKSPSEDDQQKIIDEKMSNKVKKRKRTGYGNIYKKRNVSKNLMNLPSSLSDFPWIENTEANRVLIEQEKLKILEQRRKKENERQLQQANEDMEMLEAIPQIEEIKTETKQISIKQENPNWVFKGREELESLDDIADIISNYGYHSLNSLKNDLQLIVQKTINTRCMNSLSQAYLTHVLQKGITLINSKKIEFKAKWRSAFEERFKLNQDQLTRVQGDWYKTPGAKREYNTLEDYKIVSPDPHNQEFTEAVKEKMNTTKSSQCNGQCCLQIEDLGSLKFTNEISNTKCDCRLKKVECNEKCGCNPEQCKNRQMSLNQGLKLGVDVVEKISWGLDTWTAVNITHLFPRDVPQSVYNEFIETKLMFAIQQQGIEGYDIRKALQYILNQRKNPRFTGMDRHFARVILDGIKNTKGRIDPNFRVHSKGIGIFCERKDGIKGNKLIVEYFGEIYEPWYWYEKQDILKSAAHSGKISKELPDFYNITFERHQDDPEGYDLLMVDPILYGSYSSRLSHSCNPNCQTLVQVRNGQYSIGMFAIKDIKYGEELCFNYCSVTESEKEFEQAVCLCGTELCQGKFLQLSNDKKNLTLLKKYHTFVDRNYLLWQAIQNPELTGEDEERLERFCLKSIPLKDLPNWLKKWTCLICEYIEFEEYAQIEIFRQQNSQATEEDLVNYFKLTFQKLDAKSQRDNKLWNVAITLNKRYIKFWESEFSVKKSLIEVIKCMEDCKEKEIALNIINEEIEVDPWLQGEQLFKAKFESVREKFALVSDTLRPVRSPRVMTPALCDSLILYARTETYFTPNELYKKVTGDEIKIRKCDVKMNQKPAKNSNEGEEEIVNALDPVDQEKTIVSDRKTYDPGHVWGQLVGWFKQTVDKPNASLSADRRGTVSIPDLDSFIVDEKNQQPKSKKSRKAVRDLMDEYQINKVGTKSRPMKQQNSFLSGLSEETSQPVAKSRKANKQPIIKYPHKKFFQREAFLQNWEENFSKQWDVCCNWSFRNKNKLYGSIQFESVLQAGKDRARRLDYFRNVVSYLLRQQ